jgi:hypothetical protein
MDAGLRRYGKKGMRKSAAILPNIGASDKPQSMAERA